MEEKKEKVIRLTTPLTREMAESLHMGDTVSLSGVIYAARDEAHENMVRLLEEGKDLPFDIKDAVVYYVGPAPAAPGQVIGSAGPTTSGRMDAYTPVLLHKGLRGMIGKGQRGQAVMDAMQRYPAVYFAAVGGAAALMASCVTGCEVIAWDDLGPESVKRLTLQDLPLIVAADAYGEDGFSMGQQDYLKASAR